MSRLAEIEKKNEKRKSRKSIRVFNEPDEEIAEDPRLNGCH